MTRYSQEKRQIKGLCLTYWVVGNVFKMCHLIPEAFRDDRIFGCSTQQLVNFQALGQFLHLWLENVKVLVNDNLSLINGATKMHAEDFADF